MGVGPQVGLAAETSCTSAGRRRRIGSSACRPRISSIVRNMLDVEYIVESTAPRLVYGEMTRATVRWASTWSGPFWASSSTTKIAVSFQNLLLADRFDDPAQAPGRCRRPSRSASACRRACRGVIVGQPHDLQPRHVALASRSAPVRDEAVGPLHVGIVEVEAAELGIEMAFERRHRRPCRGRSASCRWRPTRRSCGS